MTDEAAPLIELLEAGATLAGIVAGTLTLDTDEQLRALDRWERALIRLAHLHSGRE